MLNDMHDGLCPKKSNNPKKSIFQEYVYQLRKIYAYHLVVMYDSAVNKTWCILPADMYDRLPLFCKWLRVGSQWLAIMGWNNFWRNILIQEIFIKNNKSVYIASRHVWQTPPFFVNDWGQGLNNWLQLGEIFSERSMYYYSSQAPAFSRDIY